jgi:hypothetical protein
VPASSHGDIAARFLHRWLTFLTSVAIFGWLTRVLFILSGMRFEAHLALALAIGAIMTLLLAIMILRSRPLVTAGLLGDAPAEASPLRIRVAEPDRDLEVAGDPSARGQWHPGSGHAHRNARQQFLIRRESYERIKIAFDAPGIRFAYPIVTIHVTSGDGAALPDAGLKTAVGMATRAPLPRCSPNRLAAGLS